MEGLLIHQELSVTSTMGCMCCCFRPPKDEEPSALIKKDDSPTSPRKSYGAIPTEEDSLPSRGQSPSPRKSTEDLLYNSPTSKSSEELLYHSPSKKSTEEILYNSSPQSARVRSPSPKEQKKVTIKSSDESSGTDKKQKKTLAEIAGMANTTNVAFVQKRRTSTPKPSENIANTKSSDQSEHTEDQAEELFPKVTNSH